MTMIDPDKDDVIGQVIYRIFHVACFICNQLFISKLLAVAFLVLLDRLLTCHLWPVSSAMGQRMRSVRYNQNRRAACSNISQNKSFRKEGN